MVAILGKSMNLNKSLLPLQEGQATKEGLQRCCEALARVYC